MKNSIDFNHHDLLHQEEILTNKETELRELNERIAELEHQAKVHHEVVLCGHHNAKSQEQQILDLEHEVQHRVDIVIHLTESNRLLQERIEELENSLENQANLAVHLQQANQELEEQLVQAEQSHEHLTEHLKKYVDIDMSDLKIVEGIGPKIEEALKSAGIHSLYQLAQKDSANIKSMLNESGGHFNYAEPSSWPEQAHLAASGEIEELEAFQKSLNGGKVKK